MRILLVDARVTVRSALKLLVEQQTGLEVVGEVDEVGLLVDVLASTHPDLVLIDWGLLNKNAVLLLENLRDEYPDVKIIAMSGRPELRKSALETGADAFICKGDPPEQVMETLLNFV